MKKFLLVDYLMKPLKTSVTLKHLLVPIARLSAIAVSENKFSNEIEKFAR